jgi:hypothetical protein
MQLRGTGALRRARSFRSLRGSPSRRLLRLFGLTVRALALVAGVARGARERDSTPAQLHDDEQPLPIADSPN